MGCPIWAKIPIIAHQIPEAHEICLWFQNIVLYTDATVETVKLNFHLELYVTLVSNMDSGLRLELQVFCKSSFTQSLAILGYRRTSPRVELMRHTP
jgi:hypothetical protein